jgi:hypothetical protein
VNDDRQPESWYGAEAPIDHDPAHGAPTPPAPEAAQPVFPLPPGEHASLPAAFGATWQGATFHPRRLFAALPPDLPVSAVLLYYLPLGILIAGASLFWNTIGGGIYPEHDAVLESLTGGAPTLSQLVQFLFSPLLLVAQLFLSAAVTHVLLVLFRAAAGGFATTVRVFGLAYSPQLFSIVPWIGTPIAFFWMVVVSIIGLREAHRTTTGRAAAAVLVPVVFLLIMLGIAAFIAAASGLLEDVHR